MAVTAALVLAKPHRLRYLVTQDGAAGTTLTLPNTPGGGTTPNLSTDSVGLPASTTMWKLMRARVNGYGPIAAGALTQAQARALLLSNDPTNAVITNKNVLTAVCTITPNGATATSWSVDANVDGEGDPVLAIVAPAAASSVYLDIITPVQV